MSPLSLVQQQLWFIDRLAPGTPLYTISAALRLTGPLDVAALEDALVGIVNRHDSLRTVFPDVDGVPAQVVGGEVSEALQVEQGEHDVQTWIDEVAHAPFDLATGPLYRFALLRVGDNHHVLAMAIHHMVFDGASLGLLLAELKARYAGGGADLPPVPMRYADFARRQRLESRAEDLAYWRGVFRTAPPRLQLPSDRPRPAAQTNRGACLRFPLDEAVCARLTALGREQGTSLFCVMLAAFDVLLHRYTGQSDLAVGVPVSARPYAELDSVIGCFVNTVAVRADLSGDPTFRELVDRVADRAMEAFEHLGAQFDEVVEAVQPERDPSFSPLVQVTFGLLTDTVVGKPELAGLRVEPLEPRRVTAKFDLSLDVSQAADELYAELEYNVDLFDEATMRALAGHWQRLLAEAAHDPDRRIGSLPILAPEEWQRMVVDWNATQTQPPQPAMMNELFEAAALANPDATAVVHNGNRITYGELDRRANRLAHLLQAHGVGPEVCVGLCIERSIDTIVAFIGILKSGGVYLPMDPEYPPERLGFMLTDARVQLLITDSAVAAGLPDSDVPRLLLDTAQEALAACPSTAPVCAATPQNLSCAFFTSGSSGRPKCAMLTHANYAHYFSFWKNRYLRHTPMRTHLQMTSFAFDIFIADATRALFSGAALVIVPREVVMAPDRLYELMLAEKVNSAEFITPILAALAEHVAQIGGTLDFLDLLVAGSDIWYTRDYLLVRELCGPGTKMIAAYGATETSIDNATFADDDPSPLHDGIVPIGRPADNTQLYVLNEDLQPLPAGIAGELYIGGLGVGRGYLRRPAMTAEKFVPDPFCAQAGARLYRSGDMARYRPDGVLDILGRIDNQVKVGGFRIELGEIEAALRDHELVDKAAVIVYSASETERWLVAYLSTVDTAPDNAVELIRFGLQRRLPGYMVPSAIIVMEALPLSANGKVDRRALPAPDPDLLDSSSGPASPRTATEEILAGIFAEVLERPSVGVFDNFFAIGGRSLLMTQVVARVRAVWRVELPVGLVYQQPTVAGLAREVERLRHELHGTAQIGAGPVTALPRPAGGTFPTSFAQQQLWFHDRLEPGGVTYLVPTVLRLHGRLDVAAFERGLQGLVDRHESLRTVFVAERGVPRQRILPTVACPVTWHDLSSLAPAEQAAAVQGHLRSDERTPFDLATGPLVRVTGLRCGDTEHVVLLTMHHIVTDGWSAAILLDELATLYRGGQLPAVPLQYADYAAWQRDHLTDEVLDIHLDYWRGKLDGAPAAQPLPVDRPHATVQGYAGGFREFTVPQHLHSKLAQLSRQEGATLFMTLMAAFQTLLHRYSGQADIVVGAPTAGRTRVEIEQVVGFFVNLLPLRVNLAGSPSFRELVRRVRDTAIEAYAHQDLPFEKLVEKLRPGRSPVHNPIFQVVFALEKVAAEVMSMPGIEVTELPLGITTAKFDLLLSMTEGEATLGGGFSYKSDLFDAATIDLIVADWLALLGEIATNPDLPITAKPPSGLRATSSAGATPSPATPSTAPSAQVAAPPSGVAAPGELVGLIAAVWAEVLGREHVPFDADFFELGGYSLLASRASAGLEELLGMPVPIRTLFENPTVELLADHLHLTMTEADRGRLGELFAELGADA